MRRLLALIATVLLSVGYVNGASQTRPAPDPAKRMVVLVAMGDSITTAAGTCGPYLRCLDKSWVTGIDVFSVYQRLRAARKDVDVKAVNLARPGVGVAYLSEQAADAVTQHADYVTILIGANDACQWPMIDPPTFRAYLDDALTVIHKGRPTARIQIVSIPDLTHLWKIAHDNPMAQLAWRLKECPSLMTNPASIAPADVRRRKLVEKHVDAYNRQAARACKKYKNHCHWDKLWAHNVTFTLDMLGPDFFHPSMKGQQALARIPLPTSWTQR